MEQNKTMDEDIARDDMQVIQLLKKDLFGLIERIERQIQAGTLQSVERSLLPARYMALEMYLDEILMPDWDRLVKAIGSEELIPRSTSYLASLMRPLRVPTNPTTHETMGSDL
jgi:hypothetical protein